MSRAPTGQVFQPDQVPDCMDAGLQRVKHDLPSNAGDTKDDKGNDQKEDCVSVH